MSKFGQNLIDSAREALAIAEGRAEAARTVALPDVDVSTRAVRSMIQPGSQRRKDPIT